MRDEFPAYLTGSPEAVEFLNDLNQVVVHVAEVIAIVWLDERKVVMDKLAKNLPLR